MRQLSRSYCLLFSRRSDLVGAVGNNDAAPDLRASAVSAAGSVRWNGSSARDSSSRNPIFTAMMVFGFGIALVTLNLVAVAGFLLPVTTIELQVRIVEEPYLLTVHGDAYRD